MTLSADVVMSAAVLPLNTMSGERFFLKFLYSRQQIIAMTKQKSSGACAFANGIDWRIGLHALPLITLHK